MKEALQPVQWLRWVRCWFTLPFSISVLLISFFNRFPSLIGRPPDILAHPLHCAPLSFRNHMPPIPSEIFVFYALVLPIRPAIFSRFVSLTYHLFCSSAGAVMPHLFYTACYLFLNPTDLPCLDSRHRQLCQWSSGVFLALMFEY